MDGRSHVSERAATTAHRAAVCHCAADAFERRAGVTIAARWSPDELERRQRAVDLKGVGPAGEPIRCLSTRVWIAFIANETSRDGASSFLNPWRPSLIVRLSALAILF